MNLYGGAISVVLLLAVVNIGLSLYLIQRVRKMARRADSVQKIHEGQRRRLRSIQRQVDQTRAAVRRVEAFFREDGAWLQVESLVALSRIIDGKPVLPLGIEAAASPRFVRQLFDRIRAERPTRILECGASTLTVAMAYAIRDIEEACIWSLESNPHTASEVRRELASRGLDSKVRIIVAPLSERRYRELDQVFYWYDYDPASLPGEADMIVVDESFGGRVTLGRYPAVLELLPNMASHGHIFVAGSRTKDYSKLRALWRAKVPDLGVRQFTPVQGELELFLLDHKIAEFVNQHPSGEGSPEAGAAALVEGPPSEQ